MARKTRKRNVKSVKQSSPRTRMTPERKKRLAEWNLALQKQFEERTIKGSGLAGEVRSESDQGLDTKYLQGIKDGVDSMLLLISEGSIWELMRYRKMARQLSTSLSISLETALAFEKLGQEVESRVTSSSD